MIFALAACGQSAAPAAAPAAEPAAAPAAEPAAETAADIQVAMITDYGDITDQSMNMYHSLLVTTC